MLTFVLGFFITPTYAVHSGKMKMEQYVKKSEKRQKKMDKLMKRFDKMNADSELLLKKPRPWIAIGLSLLAVGLMTLGIFASFGLASGAAAIGFIGDPVPPGTLNGDAIKRNSQRLSSADFFANGSRSRLSNKGIPSATR